MTRMILADTILTYEIVVYLLILTLLVIRRKINIKQGVFICGLFTAFSVYVYKVFKTIVINGASEPLMFLKGIYSLVPFGNITNNVEEVVSEQIGNFFIGVIPFLILSGFFISGIFRSNHKNVSYKKLYVWGCMSLEILQIIAFIFVHNNLVYMGIFDSSAFLLVPILYGSGILVYKILFDRKEHSSNDKN